MVLPDKPTLILAPMEGLSDAPMRAVQGEIGAFTHAVAEFIRISESVPGKGVFRRMVPELENNAKTKMGLPVHVQLLGGNPERMAQSALVAVSAGATAIDINFGCPAKTVNNHDGGATLLKYPQRLGAIVRAVRDAVPQSIPVSAKLRLGWDDPNAIYENAQQAANGGASWITIHGRTREQGYKPPALWKPIGRVREQLQIPVVANGDIWTIDDFKRCRDETGSLHFMLGRGGLARPFLSHQIARELGLPAGQNAPDENVPMDWRPYLCKLIAASEAAGFVTPDRPSRYLLQRVKQWLRIAEHGGNFPHFDAIKQAESLDELFRCLEPAPADAR